MSNDVYVQFTDGTFASGSGWIPDEGWDGRTRDWYTDAVNAKDAFSFSDPYVDADTGGLVITVSKHFQYGNLEGVVAIDLLIDRYQMPALKLRL